MTIALTGLDTVLPALRRVTVLYQHHLAALSLFRTPLHRCHHPSPFAAHHPQKGLLTTSTTMAPLPGAHDMSGSAKKKAASPRPSASIILVSPSNQILLTHRVQTTTAFPSAHVFPGGNLSPADGPIAQSDTDPARHQDSLAYRTGAIRELFEESGILLARKSTSATSLLELSAATRTAGRHAIHGEKIPFATWLSEQTDGHGILDTENLTPFTHWITPPNVPRRYTTQMYVYFVPLSERGNESMVPTADAVETVDAEWLPAARWLERSRKGEIILFPPQFILLYLISEFLNGKGEGQSSTSDEELLVRRKRLEHFIHHDSSPPWSQKYISPMAMGLVGGDGRQMLALDQAGPELKGSGLKGEMERVVLVRFKKEGPREVDVGWRSDVLRKQREHAGKTGEAKI